ncbi:chromate resistance protein ChrB domain-containing protein [Mycobacterium sp.]|uniref:chromate resistance protein ChrB domain-containing protein n=1 Tax=Mycobacterium sp. TaxID=1785 RepID=UPI002D8A49FB|nr:chromate resistance protein ChrB domain-containing protein [Mycobacterium sp.]
MRWVTRENVHLDRVASPWLIRRSIDPDAEFVFIDPDKPWPTDAIPFALPGAEIGMHDENGSTFDKLLRRYQLDDPVLHDIADVVRAGIRHLFGEDQQGATPETLGLGMALLALSEGLMLRWPADHDNIEASCEIYDALYAYFWARRLDPRSGPETFWERMAGLRAAWRTRADATT